MIQHAFILCAVKIKKLARLILALCNRQILTMISNLIRNKFLYDIIINMKKYLIVGNWKNSPESQAEANKNFKIIKTKKVNTKKIKPVICPSLIHLAVLSKSYKGKVWEFGAQNFYINDGKFHTGETTLAQIKDTGADYVIIGHAERRQLGESNELVALKIQNAIDNKFTPILCIGEDERFGREIFESFK